MMVDVDNLSLGPASEPPLKHEYLFREPYVEEDNTAPTYDGIALE